MDATRCPTSRSSRSRSSSARRSDEARRAPAGAGVSVIPTGFARADLALGIGGVPRGRIMEGFGPEGGQDHRLPAHHRRGTGQRGLAAFIDAEHALDPPTRCELGGNIDEMSCPSPTSGAASRSPTCSYARRRSTRGHRLGRGAGPSRRDRWARWATPTWGAGSDHEPGDAQALGPLSKFDTTAISQPAPGEDRRDVRITETTREAARSSSNPRSAGRSQDRETQGRTEVVGSRTR